MAQTLRVLIIDDSEDDTLLLARMVRRVFDLSYERVETAEAMLAALEQAEWDAIISDYSMPRFSGMAALELFKTMQIDIPFIMVSGVMGEETAVEAMRAGAHDYLIKDNLDRLLPAIERELREARERRALRRAEEQVLTLSRALAQSASLVMITDPAGIVEYVNATFSEVTGFEIDEIVGRPASFLRGDAPAPHADLTGAFEQGSEWHGEMQNLKKNGETYWAAMTLSPVEDNQGKITHFLIIQEDISQRKQLENALHLYTEQLETMVEERTADLERARDEALESSRLKTQIMANMRHEARTPVSVITLKTELMSRGRYGPVTSAQQDALAAIRAEGDKLLQHIDNLVDEAQLESNMLKLEKTRFRPSEMVADLAEQMEAQFENKGLVFITEIDSEMPRCLYGAADRIRRILLNLVDNAVRFTDEGTVSLRIFQPDTDHWALQVSDTGPGIPSDAREAIFEPFWQVDGSTTRQVSRGVGLGLSIVRKSVLLMGGSISLDSEEQSGTTFTVTLPIEQEPGTSQTSL